VLLNCFYDTLNPFPHISEIHGRNFYFGKTEMRGAFHQMPDVSSHNECLAWHASVVETIAAKLAVLIDKESFCPELGRSGGNGQSSRTASQDPYVKIEFRQ
jgi:hypothetical protein